MTAYAGSKAVSGISTIVSIGPKLGTSGSPTYIPIFELKDASVSGAKFDVKDVSNFNSGIYKEKRKAMFDPGQYKLEGNDVTDDPGQVALKAALLDPNGAYLFKIEYALDEDQTTTGDVETFAAIVSEYEKSNKVGDTRTISVTIEVSGASTFTPGT